MYIYARVMYYTFYVVQTKFAQLMLDLEWNTCQKEEV